MRCMDWAFSPHIDIQKNHHHFYSTSPFTSGGLWWVRFCIAASASLSFRPFLHQRDTVLITITLWFTIPLHRMVYVLLHRCLLNILLAVLGPLLFCINIRTTCQSANIIWVNCWTLFWRISRQSLEELR